MFGTGLGGLLHGRIFHLGATLSADESYDGDNGSLASPYKNIGEAGNIGGVCTECTGNVNIVSIARILAES